jgi:endonuclease/exonuclease/phosphatase (EEP) superfamily protein YafD
VRLGEGGWVANLHATLRPEARSRSDIARAVATWADAERLVLAGDFNLRRVDAWGLEHVAGHGVDHILARGWRGGRPEVLDAGRLSDHRPVRVALSAV